MEKLLSTSFDYLSANVSEPQRIRKGLKILEGLLAQICLSESSASSMPNKRLSTVGLGSTTSVLSPKLSDLHHDPAFREFYKLQQGFQWNVATRLIECLNRLLGRESTGTNDILIIQSLELLQGSMLLHPPSRELFGREINMNLFLDLLDPSSCPAIHTSTLLALVTSLLDYPVNARTFEACDGLLAVTHLFKLPSTSREVKLKLIEFLYFYLMPESNPTRGSTTNSAVLGGRGKELVAAFDRRRETIGTPESAEMVKTKVRSSEEKQAILAKHLSNVQDLVDDLRGGGGLWGGR